MILTEDSTELINLLIIADEAQKSGDDLWLVKGYNGEAILYFEPPPDYFKILEVFRGATNNWK